MLTIIEHRLRKKISYLKSKFPDSKSYYYFAYGANIDPDFFVKRVPNIELIGTALLKDYKFDINTPCEYLNQGYGGIEFHQGSDVYGSLYKISESSLRYLDILEWVPFKFYTRDLKEVSIGNLSYSAFCYITCHPRKNLFPSAGYMNLIKKGAKKMNFPKEYSNYLETFYSQESFNIDNSFNLRNPGSKRIFKPKYYKYHDLFREKLSKLI